MVSKNTLDPSKEREKQSKKMSAGDGNQSRATIFYPKCMQRQQRWKALLCPMVSARAEQDIRADPSRRFKVIVEQK